MSFELCRHEAVQQQQEGGQGLMSIVIRPIILDETVKINEQIRKMAWRQELLRIHLR